MQFRQGDEVTLRGVVTHPDIGGKVYVEFEGVTGASAVNAIGLTLVNRQYQVGDVVEARGGQPPGPHKVLGVHEGDLWTRDQSGAHVILVGNTMQPYVEPLEEQAVRAAVGAMTEGERDRFIAGDFEPPPIPDDASAEVKAIAPHLAELMAVGWVLWSAGQQVPALLPPCRVRLLDGKELDPHADGFDWNADRSDNPIIAYIDDLPF